MYNLDTLDDSTDCIYGEVTVCSAVCSVLCAVKGLASTEPPRIGFKESLGDKQPPDVNFVDAATLPLGVATARGCLATVGLRYDTRLDAAEKKGLLVWGASSSVGVCTVQTAKAPGFTCDPRDHEYLRSLGARAAFDYKSPNVVKDILDAVKKDNVTVRAAIHAVGKIRPCLNPLAPSCTAELQGKVAITPPFNHTHAQPDVQTKFTVAPKSSGKEGERVDFAPQRWLAPRLAGGSFIPAPAARVMPGGLAGLKAALGVLEI